MLKSNFQRMITWMSFHHPHVLFRRNDLEITEKLITVTESVRKRRLHNVTKNWSSLPLCPNGKITVFENVDVFAKKSWGVRIWRPLSQPLPCSRKIAALDKLPLLCTGPNKKQCLLRIIFTENWNIVKHGLHNAYTQQEFDIILQCKYRSWELDDHNCSFKSCFPLMSGMVMVR